MRLSLLLTTVAMAAAFAFPFTDAATAETPQKKPRVSGPFVHDNLAIYLLHGETQPGRAPLTLEEAMKSAQIKVSETGTVSRLLVENTGEEPVFIQSGDIVKGGKQDRVLTTSLLVPPKSGAIEIGAYCVEQGRWAVRGNEDMAKFASAAEAVPSRAAKLAMRTPSKPYEAPAATASPQGADAPIQQTRDGVYARTRRALGFGPDSNGIAQGRSGGDAQGAVWAEVADVQAKLGASLGGSVKSRASASSLQLSLEDGAVGKARKTYADALDPGIAGAKFGATGFVFAINGKLNSADIYPHAGLFEKMLPKLMKAAITEAVASRGDGKSANTPDLAAVEDFLAKPQSAKPDVSPVGQIMTNEVRDAENALYVEARAAKGAWVHRSYVAK